MNAKQNQSFVIVVVIVIAAVLVAAIAIFVSSNRQLADGSIYTNIPANRTEDGAFVLGEPDAPITIVEFADFTCPHCQAYHQTVTQFIREYVATGKAKFEYRMFPVTGSPYMEHTAQIAECADELKPGSFWQAHDILFQLASASRYDDIGRSVATELEISYSELLQCTSTADQFVNDRQVGQTMGVSGTPAVMIRNSDGDLNWISVSGQTLNRGAVPYTVLQEVVAANQ